MYLNFIFIPLDYFRTIRFRNFLFEWGGPFALSFLTYISLYKSVTQYDFNEYVNKIISLESILVGFSITSITFLTTASNRNIENLKDKETEFVLFGKKISLMDLIIINFSFSLFSESVILITNLVSPIILLWFNVTFQTKILLFSLNVLFVLQNLFLNIRNLTDIYLALARKENETSP